MKLKPSRSRTPSIDYPGPKVYGCLSPDDDEPPEPVCEKCGAPITTGLMALLCPGRQECAMWPDDPDIEDNTFVKMFPDEYTPEQKARWRELCDERAASSAAVVQHK